MPLDSSNFCWNLTELNNSTEELLTIQSDSNTGTVTLATIDGGLTTLITRWNQMYTVLRFWWGNRLYRCTYCYSLETSVCACVSRVCYLTFLAKSSQCARAYLLILRTVLHSQHLLTCTYVLASMFRWC